MLGEEYLWRVEHAREQRRLEQLGARRDAKSVFRGRGATRRRLRFKLRWWGLSATTNTLRVVLQKDDIITYAAGRRGAFVVCLAGRVHLGERSEPEEQWRYLDSGDRLRSRTRRRVIIRALALSTVEFGEGE